MTHWRTLNENIVACQLCARLREHCENVARDKRRAFASEEYWGRPVPNFGDPHAGLLIVGLAPAAHGGNRTGRVFTGDRSGDWLYRALHKAGFANQPHATHRNDGLRLTNCCITAICHCAPPDNKPTKEEIAACQPWFDQTLAIVPARVFVALGQIAWTGLMQALVRRGWHSGPKPKFAHGAKVAIQSGKWVIGSYHPSQQNTFTGRLTEKMFDAVFQEARNLLPD